MENTQKVTASLYESLKSECDMAGVKIGTVCRHAGIDRSLIQRWKSKDPVTIQILNRFREALEQLKNKTHE